MPTDQTASDRAESNSSEAATPAGRALTPAAERALAEAAARRAERDRAAAAGPKELQGRGGGDPTRFGDWEVNGLASDF